VRLEPNQKLQV